MHRAVLAGLVGLLAVTAAVPAPAAAPAASTDGLAQLSFDPSSVRTEPGETFTVDIVVDSQPQFASGAHEVGVVFAFNTTHVRVTDIERGPYISQGNETTIETNVSRVDNEDGFVIYDLHREPPAGGVTGKGVLATVTFEAKEAAPTGTSELRYTSGRILLTDGNLQRVSASNGQVTVVRTGGTEATPTAVTGDEGSGIPTALLGGAALVAVAGLFVGLLVFVRRL